MTAPLFILAPPRSFTSISCGMIGCHPQMFGLAEINLFVRDTIGELAELWSTSKRLQGGLLRSLAEIAFSEQTESTVEAARAWLAENEDMSTAELFRTMQEWIGDRALIDKSPRHVYLPDALARMGANFPEARFLHLTRHPSDTLKSIFLLKRDIRDNALARFPELARKAEARAAPEAPERLWLKPHQNIIALLKTVPAGQTLRLRGEDLLSDPPKYLREIAEWLGIATDDAAIEAMMHPENSPFARPGPSNAPYGNDPNFLERPELRPYAFEPHPLEWVTPDGKTVQFNEEVRAQAAAFGY